MLGPQTPDQHLVRTATPDLRAIEDECVREVVAMQERVGLKAATDGEFRRRSWWLDLIMGWEGFSADRTGSEMVVAQRVGRDAGRRRGCGSRADPLAAERTVRAFEFLKATPKRCPRSRCRRR